MIKKFYLFLVFIITPLELFADTISDRFDKLEQEIAVLKRTLEIDKEEQIADESVAKVKLQKNGLAINGKDYSIIMNGIFQADARFFANDREKTNRDDFFMRRIRPSIYVNFGKKVQIRISPDFAGASTRIFDAHLDYFHKDWLKFRFGKFKSPMSLELLQSGADLLFMERGHPTSLAANRDVGVQVYGNFRNVAEYQLAIVNGAEDRGNINNDSDDKKDLIARVFTTPFKNTSLYLIDNFGFGIAGSIGGRNGSTINTEVPTYVTPGQQVFFKYKTGAFESGNQTRIYPQAYWYYKNFGIMTEYAISKQNITIGNNKQELTHKAWQIMGSFVLTGEETGYRNGVVSTIDLNPAYNPATSNLGALELVFRMGGINIDKKVFPIFASETESARKISSYGIGANWYSNANIKSSLNYEYSKFSDGSAIYRNRPPENVVSSRVQFRF